MDICPVMPYVFIEHFIINLGLAELSSLSQRISVCELLKCFHFSLDTPSLLSSLCALVHWHVGTGLGPLVPVKGNINPFYQ